MLVRQALLGSVCTRSSASLTRQAELGWWHYQTELGNEQCFAGGLLAADRTFDNQDKLQ
jgi:hypothetical protein